MPLSEKRKAYFRKYYAAKYAALSKEERKERNKRVKQKYKDTNKALHHNYQVKRKYPDAYEGTDISNSELKAWMQHNTVCVYCGSLANTIDHRVPLTKGGKHTFDNIQPTCWPCNNAKHNHTEDEFITWLHKAYEYTRTHSDCARV